MESKRSDAARAEELKGLANNYFRYNKYVLAIELYTRAIELDGHNPVYWANRAYACIKLEEYASAIQDASKAVKLDGKEVQRSAQGFSAGFSKLKGAIVLPKPRRR